MLVRPCTNVKIFDDREKRHKRVERLLASGSEAIKSSSCCCCGWSDVDDNKDEEERQIGWTDIQTDSQSRNDVRRPTSAAGGKQSSLDASQRRGDASRRQTSSSEDEHSDIVANTGRVSLPRRTSSSNRRWANYTAPSRSSRDADDFCTVHIHRIQLNTQFSYLNSFTERQKYHKHG